MPIVRIVSPREVTFDMYQQVDAKLQEQSDPPEGLIVHTASVVDGKLKIVDVWESEEHAQRFGRERLGPAIAEVAGEEMAAPPDPEQVEIYEIKSMILPQRAAV
jgi:hypothetical protein